MRPHIGNRLRKQLQDYVRDQLNALENRQAQLRQGLRYFPTVLTADTTIPAGRQLVIDHLEIAEGATLTVSGRLRVLSGITNLGHILIDETGSLHNG